MPNPPAELAWLGIIASIVAILGTLINLLILWRKRGRIQCRVVTAKVYYQQYRDYDIPNVAQTGPLLRARPGDCKWAFIVLEFSVTNMHPFDVPIGRFLIDGWMFSGKYIRMMYDYRRDYRVFDLYTGLPTTLDKFTKVSPGNSLGFRIEALEETDGPIYQSHQRSVIHLPKSYIVEFRQDGTKRHHKLKLPSPTESVMPEFQDVNRCSDLLGPTQRTYLGEALPTGINREDLFLKTWQDRFLDWTHTLYSHRFLRWLSEPAQRVALFLSRHASR